MAIIHSSAKFQTQFFENGLKLKKLAFKSFSEAQNWLRPAKYDNLDIFMSTCFLGIFRPQTDIFAFLQTKKPKEKRESKNIQNSPLAFV